MSKRKLAKEKKPIPAYLIPRDKHRQSAAHNIYNTRTWVFKETYCGVKISVMQAPAAVCTFCFCLEGGKKPYCSGYTYPNEEKAVEDAKKKIDGGF